eukprot:s31_g12.t1
MPGPLAAPTPERLPETRRLGQGLYLAPLKELPGCAFFPRHHYATVALSSGDAFFLLGGSNGRIHLNDIWFARLCNIGGQPDWAWSEVSEHQDGRRDPLDGQLMLSKFPGRSRFAAAGVLNAKGGTARALYVTGGQGAFCPEDFWASEDAGRTWYCMCRRVPWGGRLEPGLSVVPTKYEQVVEAFQSESKHRLKLRTIYLLAASMGASRISTATGRRGRRLQQLELELTEPAADLLKLLDQEIHSEVQGAFREVGNFRLRQLKRVLARMPLQPLVKLFPSQSPLGVEAQLDLLRLEMLLAFPPPGRAGRSLLVLGGARLAEDAAGDRAHAGGSRFLDDAWEVRLDFIESTLQARELATSEAPEGDENGFDSHMAAFDASASLSTAAGEVWPRPGGALMLRCGQVYLAPLTAPHAWAPSAQLREGWNTKRQLQHVFVASGPRASCPRLLVFGADGVAASGAGEICAQRELLRRLGADMEAATGLPCPLWHRGLALHVAGAGVLVSADTVKSAQDLFYSLLGNIVNNVSSLILGVLLTMLYTLFWLCSPVKRTAEHTDFNLCRWFKTLACFGYGISAGLLLYSLSVDLASVFALTTFALNFVPEVGPFIAMVLPCPVIILDSRIDRPMLVLFVAILGQLALKFAFSNIIEVKLIESDKKLRMHPVMILLSVGVFGYLWGPTGMLLSVPLMALMKIALFSELVPSSYRDPILVILEGDRNAPRKHGLKAGAARSPGPGIRKTEDGDTETEVKVLSGACAAVVVVVVVVVVVCALAPGELHLVENQKILSILNRHPVERTNFLKLVEEHLDKLAAPRVIYHKLFADFSQQKLFFPQEVIVKEGGTGNRMYIMNLGSATVKVSKQCVMQIRGGSHFGFNMLCSDKERYTMSITTDTMCQVLVVTRSSYQHALSKYPEMREVAKQLEAHLVLKSVLTLPGWKGNRSHPKNRWYHGSRCLHTAAVGPPARIVPSRMYWQDHCISHASSLKREKADAMLSKGTADVQARERARERKQFAQFTKLVQRRRGLRYLVEALRDGVLSDARTAMNDNHKTTLLSVIRGWRHEVAKSAEIRREDEQTGLRMFNDAQINKWLQKRKEQLANVRTERELTRDMINSLASRGLSQNHGPVQRQKRKPQEAPTIASGAADWSAKEEKIRDWTPAKQRLAQIGVSIFKNSVPMKPVEEATPTSLSHCVGPTAFTSIPAAFWWAIATLTTVGYGDMVPQSPPGKVIGALTAVTGLVVVAIGIALVSLNFKQCFAEEKAKQALDKLERRNKRRSAEKAHLKAMLGMLESHTAGLVSDVEVFKTQILGLSSDAGSCEHGSAAVLRQSPVCKAKVKCKCGYLHARFNAKHAEPLKEGQETKHNRASVSDHAATTLAAKSTSGMPTLTKGGDLPVLPNAGDPTRAGQQRKALPWQEIATAVAGPLKQICGPRQDGQRMLEATLRNVPIREDEPFPGLPCVAFSLGGIMGASQSFMDLSGSPLEELGKGILPFAEPHMRRQFQLCLAAQN